MNKNEFFQIMKDGFEIEIEDFENSSLRCFECGKKVRAYESGILIKRLVIECENKNKHQFEALDFLIKHINMRDGATKEFLNTNCSFKEV